MRKRHHPSSSGGSTAVAQSTLPRQRGTFLHKSAMFGYGDIDTWTEWGWVTDGRLLTSRLPDGQHAPVLDVDRPIRVRDQDRGVGARLTVHLRPAVARRIARALHARGHLSVEDSHYIEASTSGLSRLAWRARPVQFDLPFPIIAVPSASPGHFHLLIEQPMPWEQAHALATAMRGIVDRSWLRATGSDPGMIVCQPPTAHQPATPGEPVPVKATGCIDWFRDKWEGFKIFWY